MLSRPFGRKAQAESTPQGRGDDPAGPSKDDIQEIRFDVEAGGECALSMMLCRDGTVGRKGSGQVPAPSVTVLGVADPQWFLEVLGSLDVRVLARPGVYDLPDKSGVPVTYKAAFLGGAPSARVMLYGFGFMTGSEARADRSLLPYFDRLIGHAVGLTEAWYQEQLANQARRS